MKVRVLAATKPGYILEREEAIRFSGFEAGICYMPNDIDTLLSESIEKKEKRALKTLESGHHSVYGHLYYNFVFENIPKILAMVLNNEKIYNTSEKSARYTKMEPSKQEEDVYNKWINIYQKRIVEVYPDLEEDSKKVTKLAMENARYAISVFTPATTMGYSVDFRQINYIIHMMQDFCKNAEINAFNIKLGECFLDFIKEISPLVENDALKDNKNRGLSLFAKRTRQEEFGENYSVNYHGSFTEVAQAQRHRTLNYEISIPKNASFFVPPIIKGTKLENEWIKDLNSLSKFYPQGMLVDINERGTAENFVLKCKERLCGSAQLEIAMQTKNNMDRYLAGVKQNNNDVYKYLLPYSKGSRCTFPDFKCTNPCMWGSVNALNRKI